MTDEVDQFFKNDHSVAIHCWFFVGFVHCDELDSNEEKIVNKLRPVLCVDLKH